MSRSIHLRSALIGGLVAGLIVTALPAMAAVVGDALELGTTNTINKTTTLRVGSRRAALAVTNTRTGPALQVKGQRNVVKITAEAGKSPIWVNAAAGTAKNLSADKLDGLDSSAFLGASAKAVDAELLDGMDSTAFLVDATAFLGATAQAADSNLLDGLDSTAFLGATSKAADANKLDGRDSTAFLRVAFDADDNLPDGDDSAAFVSNVGEPLSVSITAPTAGWLVMTGTVDAVSTTHTDDYNACDHDDLLRPCSGS